MACVSVALRREVWEARNKKRIAKIGERQPMNAAKIARIVAILVAVVAAFVTAIPYIAAILAVLGLIVGFIGVEEERRLLFFVMAVTLTMVAGALSGIPMFGVYLTAILSNISAVINAGAVAVIVTIIYERVTE